MNLRKINKFILPSLRHYSPAKAKNDVFAGVIVAALTIPMAMGYAQVAGLPPVYGLYGSILPVLGYALFASSPEMIFGMNAATSAITSSIFITLGIELGSKEAITVAPQLALFTSLFLFLFAILRLGRFAGYISTPVMSGFLSGTALSILIGQALQIMGLKSAGTDFLGNMEVFFDKVADTNLIALLIGSLTVAIILVAKKFAPRFPMGLAILVLGTILSGVLHFDKLGITIVGKIPSGFPAFSFPDIFHEPHVTTYVSMGFVVALVIFADSLMTTNSFAIKGKYKVKDNQELFAFGISNLFSSLIGCSPTSSSVSRTAASHNFHGKTQMVSIVSIAVVGLVLAFLSKFLYYMPQPVLSGIIFASLVNVLDIALLTSLIKKVKREALVWIASALGVLIGGVLVGVIVGVFLSFVDVIIKIASPHQAFLGRIPGKHGFYNLERNPDAVPIPGVVIFRFSARLFFGNIDSFKKSIEKSVKEDTMAVIIDASGINSIDSTAAEGLGILIRYLKRKKVKYYFAEQIASINDQFIRLGLGDIVEKNHTAKTIEDALIDLDITV